MFQLLTGIFGVGAKTADRWITMGIYNLHQLQSSGQTLNQAQQAGLCLCLNFGSAFGSRPLLWVNTLSSCRTWTLWGPKPAGHQSRGWWHWWRSAEGCPVCAAWSTARSDWRIQEVHQQSSSGSDQCSRSSYCIYLQWWKWNCWYFVQRKANRPWCWLPNNTPRGGQRSRTFAQSGFPVKVSGKTMTVALYMSSVVRLDLRWPHSFNRSSLQPGFPFVPENHKKLLPGVWGPSHSAVLQHGPIWEVFFHL